mgnify:CR=1 FL=1
MDRLNAMDVFVRVAETDPSKAPFQDNVLTHDLDRFDRRHHPSL